MFRRSDLGLVRIVPAAVALLVFAQTATLPATQDPPLPSGREILAKHVKAIGGEAPYKAVKSIRASGRFEMPAQQISGDFVMMAARPNKQRVQGHGERHRRDRIRVRRQSRLAHGSACRVPRCSTDKELSEAADDAWFDGALYGSDFVSRSDDRRSRSPFEGQPAYKVKLVLKSEERALRVLRRRTRGLQIGSESTRATPQGLVPVTSVLRDYRKYRRVDAAREPDPETDGHRADRQRQHVRVRQRACRRVRSAARDQSSDQVIAGFVLLLGAARLRRCSRPARGAPASPALAASLASFDEVWQTINDTYYDPKFGGPRLESDPRRASSEGRGGDVRRTRSGSSSGRCSAA